ncbi:MAG: hypothetical protein HPY60_11495 [Candidatus Methanofastidiosum sp.]|nr:hypothetical protein [Methanofastidiosum sp.]
MAKLVTEKERENLRKQLVEAMKELRAKGIKYEQMALEIGLSLDSVRRFLYDSKRTPAEITIRKIQNWLKKRNGEKLNVL